MDQRQPGYLPPVAIGETMRALGLGRVVESKHPDYEEGQLVQGLTGWTENFIASDAAPLQRVPEIEGVSPSLYLGALGMTGLTAWVGMKEIGKPQGGRDGRRLGRRRRGRLGRRTARQARRRPRRRHRRRAREVLDPHREARLRRGRRPPRRRLARAAQGRHPGRHRRRLRERRRRDHGRDLRPPQPPRPGRPLRADLRLQRQRPAARPARDLRQPAGQAGHPAGLHHPRPLRPSWRRSRRSWPEWIADGSLEPLETVVEGFEQLPSAINMLFDGANVGKLVVRVGA